MTSHQPPARRAFTLVEMLVVITILGILSGFLLVGVNAARKAAKRGGILMELKTIDEAFKRFKTENDAVPPNLAHWHGNAFSPTHEQIDADFKRYLKKVFPRHQEPPAMIARLVSRAPLPGASHDMTEGMNAAEAVVFWLGGFSDDVRFPISGKGGPAYDTAVNTRDPIEERNSKFEFDVARLGPRDVNNEFAGRWIDYNHPVTGHTMRINLWTYTPPKSQVPYTYIDTSRYKPAGANTTQVYYDVPYFLPTDSASVVYPIKTVAAGKTIANAQTDDLVWATPKSFQILHCGIDDEWGDFTALSSQRIVSGDGIVYPSGPFTESIGDTLVNFSPNSLEDSEE